MSDLEPTADLARISRDTLAHYEARATEFLAATRDHDVTQNIDALLSRIEGSPPFSILDFGCGPGRDLRTFRSLGHAAIGLDGCAAFADQARALSRCEVWVQDFLALELPPERFDGIFANASLFHVPSAALPRVLREMCATLKPRGVLFASNPRGQNDEGWQRGRYGAFHDIDRWRAFVVSAGFDEIDHYYRPSGKPRAEQPWLATVWRKRSQMADQGFSSSASPVALR